MGPKVRPAASVLVVKPTPDFASPQNGIPARSGSVNFWLVVIYDFHFSWRHDVFAYADGIICPLRDLIALVRNTLVQDFTLERFVLRWQHGVTRSRKLGVDDIRVLVPVINADPHL